VPARPAPARPALRAGRATTSEERTTEPLRMSAPLSTAAERDTKRSSFRIGRLRKKGGKRAGPTGGRPRGSSARGGDRLLELVHQFGTDLLGELVMHRCRGLAEGRELRVVERAHARTAVLDGVHIAGFAARGLLALEGRHLARGVHQQLLVL